jgi:hypothetical protein
MAAEYTDENVPMACSECDELVNGVPHMVEHILDAHPTYTFEEAEKFAQLWAESAHEDIDLANMRLTEEHRRNHPNG